MARSPKQPGNSRALVPRVNSGKRVTGPPAVTGDGSVGWRRGKKILGLILFLLFVAAVLKGGSYLIEGPRPSVPPAVSGSAEPIATKGSQLPGNLSSYLAVLVVSVTKKGQKAAFHHSSHYNLDTKAGHLVVSSDGKAILTTLDIIRPEPRGFKFSMMEIDIAGSQVNFNSESLNCSFRVEIMSTLDLLEKNEIFVLIEKWNLDSSKGLCRLNSDWTVR